MCVIVCKKNQDDFMRQKYNPHWPSHWIRHLNLIFIDLIIVGQYMCELILTGVFDGMKGQSNCVRLKELTAEKNTLRKRSLCYYFLSYLI